MLESLGHEVEASTPEALDDAALSSAFGKVVAGGAARQAATVEQMLGRAVEPDDFDEWTWFLKLYVNSAAYTDYPLEGIRDWLLSRTVLPRSSFGRAIGYTLELWPGLKRFLTDPAIPIDNNQTERALRGVAVGRKNHYGSRSQRGTEVAALFLQPHRVVQARRNRAEPLSRRGCTPRHREFRHRHSAAPSPAGLGSPSTSRPLPSAPILGDSLTACYTGDGEHLHLIYDQSAPYSEIRPAVTRPPLEERWPRGRGV
ncbi:MAG: transposase [Gemmatimonadetes bacterium]|nr:transposase [Gemmatimonadota bacterium]